jgi:uncharacterized delta-60 repeat protein
MSIAGRFAAAFTTLLLASSTSQPMWAADRSGRLDPSFGSRGRVLTNLNGGSYEAAYALAIQADEKIVAAGFSAVGPNAPDFAIARYTPNGHLDRQFGAEGKVATDFSGSGSLDIPYAMAIDSNGRIVVAGESNANGGNDFALALYDPGGTLDASFNSTGKVLTDLGGLFDGATSVAIDGNGKFVVAGITNANGNYDFAVARYNLDGTLDGSFNSVGKVLTDFSGSGSLDLASAVAVQADGKIVVAGLSDASGHPYDFALARYNPDGTLDTTFNSTGKVLTDFSQSGSYDIARAMAIDASGTIVVAGWSTAANRSADFAVARYNPDGTLDGSFNSTGKVLTDFVGPGSPDEAYDVTVLSNGKIVVVGSSNLGGSAGLSDFAVARYNDDGTLDDSFNATGKVLTDFGGSEVASATAIDPNGKIVAAGFSNVNETSDFALARYLR